MQVNTKYDSAIFDIIIKINKFLKENNQIIVNEIDFNNKMHLLFLDIYNNYKYYFITHKENIYITNFNIFFYIKNYKKIKKFNIFYLRNIKNNNKILNIDNFFKELKEKMNVDFYFFYNLYDYYFNKE